MDTDCGYQESVSPSGSEKINLSMGVFECNICFDIAQDPIVTLCGHLFCWPCLYKWLQFHSYSHECPVCKSLVKQDNVVPIYGRGASSSDLRVHPLSRDEIHIPSRPASRRPQTAPVPELTYFRQDGFGATGELMPMTTATLGNSTRTALFGAIPSLLNVGGFHDVTAYGAASGFSYRFSSYAHRGYGHGGFAHGGFPHYPINLQGVKSVLLKICFLVLGVIVVLLFVLSS